MKLFPSFGSIIKWTAKLVFLAPLQLSIQWLRAHCTKPAHALCRFFSVATHTARAERKRFFTVARMAFASFNAVSPRIVTPVCVDRGTFNALVSVLGPKRLVLGVYTRLVEHVSDRTPTRGAPKQVHSTFALGVRFVGHCFFALLLGVVVIVG